MASTWTLDEAVALCRLIETVAPKAGCHVALTGGVLYKDGPRKDVDIIVYRIRQEDQVDGTKLVRLLAGIGITPTYGEPEKWLMKATYQGKRIDFLFPENEEGEYEPEEADATPRREPLTSIDTMEENDVGF